MKRISVDKPGEGRIQWKKLGKGFFRLPNRIIKPGQVFWAHPDEIPVEFGDAIVPLVPEDLKEEVPVETSLKRRTRRMSEPSQELPVEEVVEKPVYNIVRRNETSPWYDLFDAEGKKMNAKALRLEEAEEFKESLEE